MAKSLTPEQQEQLGKSLRRLLVGSTHRSWRGLARLRPANDGLPFEEAFQAFAGILRPAGY
jgi:hypothetical protein